MRLVYLGTPDDAVPPLHALVEAGHDLALVITQPDRRRSRGAGSDPSPVKRAALELGLRVVMPEKAREVIDDVSTSGAEIGVVVAFGQLLPVAFLESLPLGFVNVHFSLLPRWRGAAPVERAILAGDGETGVCLMRVEAGLDTGPVYACTRVPIDESTAGELREELVRAASRLLVDQLPGIAASEPVPQAGEATYADKLTVEEFMLGPQRAAVELARTVRAGNPRPGAWFAIDGRRYKVWRAHSDDTSSTGVGVLDDQGLGTVAGTLVIDEIQPEGKRRMPYREWRRGAPRELSLEPS